MSLPEADITARGAVFVIPVIVFASWGWKASAIAFTCAVVAGGAREAAGVTAAPPVR
ncbi:hypothetical protein ACFQ51_30090 [Streptomyces kaempferi]